MAFLHGIRIVEAGYPGDGAGSGGDSSPPVIVSGPLGAVVSLRPYETTLAASEAVTFALRAGADSALFALDGATLRLPPQNADAGKTVFVARLTATDAAGNATDFEHTVTITPAAGVLDFSDPLNSGLQ